MQEINRAAALLGPKIQECNTRDKQELGAACPLDQTTGLLSSQTLRPSCWSWGVARDGAGLRPSGRHRPTCARQNFRNHHQGLLFSHRLTDYSWPPEERGASGRRSPIQAGHVPTPEFAGNSPAMWGLLHMLQTWKNGAPGYGGALDVKLAPIPSRRVVQLFGRIVQFFSRTTLLQVISHESNSDRRNDGAVRNRWRAASTPSGPTVIGATAANCGSTPGPCPRSD